MGALARQGFRLTCVLQVEGRGFLLGPGTLPLLFKYLLLPLHFQVLGMSVINKVCDIFELPYLNTNHAPCKCNKHKCPLDLFPEERIPIYN